MSQVGFRKCYQGNMYEKVHMDKQSVKVSSIMRHILYVYLI